MTLDQLRVFVAVAERLHMTLAAAALNLTQSAASSSIRALETRLGAPLFDRVGRHLELTGAGQALLPEARAVLARAAEAERALDDLSGLARGSLRLHASQTIGNYWLPARLHAFRARHPGIALTLAIGNTEQVAEAVLAGMAELGFVEGAISHPPLASAVVGRDRLAVIEAAAGETGATTDALGNAAWVMREPGSGTRQRLEAALGEAGIDTRRLLIAFALPSNESVIAAVEAGAGVAAVSELAAAAGLAAGRLRRLSMTLPPRPFLALWHAERRRSRAAAALIALLREREAGQDA